MNKNIFDIFICLILSPVWLGLTLVGALIVLLVSPGNPFYLSRRVGQFGVPINIFKLRTMVLNADRIGSGTTSKNDPRLIKSGRFLRLTKIDEMPQFLSVLKGDISIAGPRPELQQYVDLYSEYEKKLILSVKPGIVDYGTLAFPDLQSTLGTDAAEEKFINFLSKKKIELRLKDVENQSFLNDLRILIKTPFSILSSIIKTVRKENDSTE